MTSAADLISAAVSTASSMQSSATSSLSQMVSTAMSTGFSITTPGTISAGTLPDVPTVADINSDMSKYIPDASTILTQNPQIPDAWATVINKNFPSTELDDLFSAFLTPAYLKDASAAFVASLTRTLSDRRTTAAADYARRGFSIPGGALSAVLAEGERDANTKIVEFETSLALQHQERWFAFVSELASRYLESRRAALAAYIQLVTAMIEGELKVSDAGARIAEAETRLKLAVVGVEQERYRSVLAKAQLQVQTDTANANLALESSKANTQIIQENARLKISALGSAAEHFSSIAASAIASTLGVASTVESA